MPRLLTVLLKTELVQFLRENEVTFDEKKTRDELQELAREKLIQAGIVPDLFDFCSNRSLTYANPLGEALPHQVRDLPPPEGFPLEPAANAAARWERWLKRFDIYSSAVKLCQESPEVQRSIFLCVAGPEVLDLTENLVEDTGLIDPYLRARKAVGEYFRPCRNRHFERHLFMNIIQESGEAIDAFVARLRHAGAACEFPSVDERVLEQVIERCHSAQLRKKLLGKGNDLVLASALTMARAFESVNAQSLAMEKRSFASTSGPPATCAVLANTTDSSVRKCLFCNRTHPFKKELCPALNTTCRSCGKVGHFAEVCRSEKKIKKLGSLGKKARKRFV